MEAAANLGVSVQLAGFPTEKAIVHGRMDSRIALVVPQSLATRIDDWRRGQPGLPSRSAAFRMLVEQALDAEPDPKT